MMYFRQMSPPHQVYYKLETHPFGPYYTCYKKKREVCKGKLIDI